MVNRSDPRFIQSEHAICNALARLLDRKSLSSISMAELAREASVSRGALYAHFGNVNEAYERSVQLFYEQIQTLDEHFACASCRGEKTVRPFCERLRSAGSYKSIVRDERFMPITIRSFELAGSGGLKKRLQRAGVPEHLAQAIQLFQMNGCYAIATATDADDEEWADYQGVLDRFIQGGLAALGVDMS